MVRSALVNNAEMNRGALVKSLLERGAFETAMAEINRLLDQAEVALALLSENDYVKGLRCMVVYLRGLATTKVGVFLDASR
jgi:hypothetical protein